MRIIPAAAAAVCGLAVLLSLIAAIRGRADLILVAAFFALALAQLASYIVPPEEGQGRLVQALRREVHSLRARLAVLEELASLSGVDPQAVAAPAGAGLEAAGPEESIDLYLEPIVNLASGQTMHYRASLTMQLPGGMRFDMESVQRGAERAGVGPLVEFITLKRSLEVARHLHAKGREGAVFCPVSAASFANADFITRAVAELQANPGLAASIIFEISETTMAGLSDEGMNGLATLSDNGAGFCLASSTGKGAGPAILMGLGIRHLILDAELLLSGQVRDFTQSCRRAGLTIIAAGVENATQTEGLRNHAEFAFGPRFASPRMVRSKLKAA